MVALIFMSSGSASIPSDPSLLWIDAVKMLRLFPLGDQPLRSTAGLSEPSRLEVD